MQYVTSPENFRLKLALSGNNSQYIIQNAVDDFEMTPKVGHNFRGHFIESETAFLFRLLYSIDMVACDPDSFVQKNIFLFFLGIFF